MMRFKLILFKISVISSSRELSVNRPNSDDFYEEEQYDV